MEYINKIICGRDMDILPRLPAGSVNCVSTSPPYWGLRDYGIEPVIWDGDKDCKHEWIEGKSAGDIRFRPGHNTSVGNNKNPDIWVRPSRIEFANRTINGVCPVCNKKFEGKPGKKFCSIKCLNTLSNAERTAKGGMSNFCLKCNAWRGSLGLEPTFELYIKHLCDIFDEVKRVLRKDGTCWVNLGDTYNSHSAKSKNVGGFEGEQMRNNKAYSDSKIVLKKIGVPDKSLCLIPQRFAIEMVNRGWILRNTIIWHKPNCMPSSAKDRFTVDFEYVYFFTKSKKYWFEQQFEEIQESTKQDKRTINGYKNIRGRSWDKDPNSMFGKMGSMKVNPNGRNKRAVWTIPTQPFPEAHFAVYPEKLIEPMIKAGCPRYVCKKCGKTRVKIYKKETTFHSGSGKSGNIPKGKWEGKEQQISGDYDIRMGPKINIKEVGYTNCGCNAGWEGGVVLDPFMGAGTTAVVAKKQGKQYIGIEIKQEYINMANKRIKKIPELLF